MNIAQFKIKEQIKIANFKYRGNVSEIAKDVGHPEVYVRKVLLKLKKEEDRNVAVMIANNLMQYLYSGHQQRIQYLSEMMVQLNKKESQNVSTCCKYPVFTEPDAVNHRDVVKCSKCSIICNTMTITHQDVFKLKMKVLKELRDEDESLASFAERMGYSNNPILPRTIESNSKPSSDDTKVLAPLQGDVIKAIADMHPRERDKLRKKLETQIIDFSNQKSESIEIPKETE